VEVKAEYAKELARALKEYFPEAMLEHVQKAIITVGERVADDARKFCPVRTGYLQSTIGLQPDVNKWTFYVVATAPYAIYVEYGTRRMAPRLFVTRAVELHRQELLDEVVRAVGEAAEEAFH